MRDNVPKGIFATLSCIQWTSDYHLAIYYFLFLTRQPPVMNAKIR